MSVPARNNFSIIFGSKEEGPRVDTCFVDLRKRTGRIGVSSIVSFSIGVLYSIEEVIVGVKAVVFVFLVFIIDDFIETELIDEEGKEKECVSNPENRNTAMKEKNILLRMYFIVLLLLLLLLL